MLRRIASFPLRGTEEKLRGHQELVLESVALLKGLVDACRSGDWGAVRKTADRIAGIERQADEVKRGIEMRLYKGALFVGLKEDFLRLTESLDMISDKAKDAARVLSSREPRREEVEALFKDCPEIERLIEGTIEIVKEFDASIKLLDKDTREALEAAHRVEKHEERLDEIKLSLLTRLSEREGDFSTLTYLQFRDFVLMIDTIADAAEEGSDVLTAMILKATS